jgi:hypothetical protein
VRQRMNRKRHKHHPFPSTFPHTFVTSLSVYI